MEKEKLAFRSDIEGKAHILSCLYGASEHIARVAVEGCAVIPVNIAYQTGNLALFGMPWENYEAVVIGTQIHIRLLNSHKALD